MKIREKLRFPTMLGILTVGAIVSVIMKDIFVFLMFAMLAVVWEDSMGKRRRNSE